MSALEKAEVRNVVPPGDNGEEEDEEEEEEDEEDEEGEEDEDEVEVEYGGEDENDFYVCEHGCGFMGPYHAVENHEQACDGMPR